MSRFSRLVLQRCINGGLQRWVDVHRHNDLLRLLALQRSTLLQHLNYLEMQIHGGEMRRMVMFLQVMWNREKFQEISWAAGQGQPVPLPGSAM